MNESPLLGLAQFPLINLQTSRAGNVGTRVQCLDTRGTILSLGGPFTPYGKYLGKGSPVSGLNRGHRERQ